MVIYLILRGRCRLKHIVALMVVVVTILNTAIDELMRYMLD